MAADAGEVRLVASSATTGCALGDEGRYGWSRSDDGMFLTITPVEEECATRAETLGRTWVRSLGAVNDGGRGVANGDPAMEITLPRERFAMSDLAGAMYIHSDAGYELTTTADAVGYGEPCGPAGTSDPLALTPGADAYATYLRGLPAFDVETTAHTIDGNRAVHFAITSDAGVGCPAREIAVFGASDDSDEAAVSILPGDPLSIWVVEHGNHVYVFRYSGSAVTPANETPVMSSVRFRDELPTP